VGEYNLIDNVVNSIRSLIVVLRPGVIYYQCRWTGIESISQTEMSNVNSIAYVSGQIIGDSIRRSNTGVSNFGW